MSAERPWEHRPGADSAGPRKINPLWWVAGGIVAISVAYGFAVDGGTSGSGGPGGSELACKNKVRAQIGQAEFTNVKSYEAPEGTWTVNGFADGRTFICTLEYVDGETYRGDAQVY